MEFTVNAYESLLAQLDAGGYSFASYHSYKKYPRCVILRHDIDNSLEKALELAEIEKQAGVSSTYFVLLTSNFYNVASQKNRDILEQIRCLGHEIGLHFDEVAYPSARDPEETIQRILHEQDLLSRILGVNITTVSMHRPSKTTLDADLTIPGMVNSYGKTFFQDFKYLSDSRRRWREPVEEIIRSGQYDRLHILTHAFWYHKTEQSIEKTVKSFIRHANAERYDQMAENITDLTSIVEREVCL